MNTTVMWCEKLQIPLNLLMIAVYLAAIFIFAALVTLLFMARSTFHPLFCLFFSTIIVCYIVCNFLTITNMCLRVLHFESDVVYAVIDTFYQVTYIYLTCNVERFLATIFSKVHEYRRYWQIAAIGQVLSASIIILHVKVYKLGGIVSDLVQLSLNAVIIVCLIALLAVNRRLTLSTRGVRSLSSRYQITENVRALRLLVPVVVLDTSVTCADMLGSQLFRILPIFETEKCVTIRAYMVAYVVLRSAAVVLQYGIPVFIIRHKSIRKVIPITWCRVKVDSKRLGPLEIRNVLGIVLSKEGNQKNYFSYLQNQWNI